jgi:signal transduction histidine kinase
MAEARAAIEPSRQSLRRRLVTTGLALSTLFLVITGVVLSSYYRATTERLFDESIKVSLIALVADVVSYVEDEEKQPGNLGDPRFSIVASGWYWQIERLGPADSTGTGTANSEMLFASNSLAGGSLVMPGDATVTPGRPGEKSSTIAGPDGRRLRIFERRIDLGSDGIFLVAVAGDLADVDEQKRQFDISILLAFAALGFALAAATLLQVRYGLAPMERLGRSLAAIRRGDIERIRGRYPQEITPIVTEINLLLDANREIVDRARTQVGNLAHALKTPLSVMQTEAELLKGPLSDKVVEQTGVMREQVQHYLDRARAAARAITSANTTDVTAALEAFARTFAKINQRRGIAVEARIARDLSFRGEKQDFDDIVGNLVDNASKWAKSTVEISAGKHVNENDARVTIEIIIDDDGPGIPPEERKKALERGKRLDETRPGSGLGLSIVADLAGLYRGELVLETSPHGGLRALIRLPAAV